MVGSHGTLVCRDTPVEKHCSSHNCGYRRNPIGHRCSKRRNFSFISIFCLPFEIFSEILFGLLFRNWLVSRLARSCVNTPFRKRKNAEKRKHARFRPSIINYINVLWTAFAWACPKSAKRHLCLKCLFELLGWRQDKVACKHVGEIDPRVLKHASRGPHVGLHKYMCGPHSSQTLSKYDF